MKIFVTGGEGYIGLHMVRMLVALGHSVVTSIRKDWEWMLFVNQLEQIIAHAW